MRERKETVIATAPATVANVGCGFDIFGFALSLPSDQVGVRLNNFSRVRLTEVTGDGHRLPREPEKNVASHVVQKFLQSLGTKQGVDVSLHKGIPLSSGLGSSAASAVAALVAVNTLFQKPYDKNELLLFAVEGERLASGAPHPDNVTPCLVGGFTLIPGTDLGDIISLPVPENLTCVIVHPEVEVETKTARSVLPESIPLKLAVRQWGHTAAFVSSLFSREVEKLGRYMEDFIIEPARKNLIPGFSDVKQAAMDAGALACTISGAGPSMFSFTHQENLAPDIARRMQEAFANHGLDSSVYISKISLTGGHVIEPNQS